MYHSKKKHQRKYNPFQNEEQECDNYGQSRKYHHIDRRNGERNNKYKKKIYNHHQKNNSWLPMQYLPDLNYQGFKIPMSVKIDSKTLSTPYRRICNNYFTPYRGCNYPNCRYYHPKVCYHFISPHKQCELNDCFKLHLEGTIIESILFLQRERVSNYTYRGSYFRKSIDTVTRLNIFDFDGTLVNSWTPDYGKDYFKKMMGMEYEEKAWWSTSKSLTGVLEPMYGPASDEILKISNPAYYNIMLTGRNADCMDQIVKSCHKMGAHGHIHNYVCKPNFWELTTVHFKLAYMVLLLKKQFVRVRTIHIWEDRKEHVYFFKKLAAPLSKLIGRKIKIKVHQVYPVPLGLFLLGDVFADVHVEF
mmetsp:Transcript_5010/g.7429  ORF Transcript_5010/g.7429 Transcript_5010/m.7429 type:complete len:360 (+) Transcript_5010:19-1098(+)